jgi:hypothetical protein
MVVADINYCEMKKRGLADSSIKTYKKCNMFEFNEISALDLDKRYKPRVSKIDENQGKLF